MGDARLIDELLKLNQIASCSIGCPSQASSKGQGRGAFPRYLASIQTARTRFNSVPLRGLLVVADANGNAAKSFKDVSESLQESKFPVPSRAFNIEEVDRLRVAVYLVPGEGETGTLEHILLRAVFKKSPDLEGCLDNFSTCTGGLRSTDPNLQAKMRMSALAAAFCEENPWCSPNLIWSTAGNPVPIDSDCFAGLSKFLADFSA
jgi:hypothetical protein